MGLKHSLSIAFAASLATALLVAFSGDRDPGDPGSPAPGPAGDAAGPPVPHSGTVTLDEDGCTYEGDKTPKAPAFWMDIVKSVSDYNWIGAARIPADVTNDEVEAFFEDAQETLEEGEEFHGFPAEWRSMGGGGGPGGGEGGMLVGDPRSDKGALVAGQKYVVWCSIGPPPGWLLAPSPSMRVRSVPPTALYLAAVIEPTD